MKYKFFETCRATLDYIATLGTDDIRLTVTGSGRYQVGVPL